MVRVRKWPWKKPYNWAVVVISVKKNMTLDRMLLLHPQSFLKVKEACSSLWWTNHRATVRHLSYGITQCYLQAPPRRVGTWKAELTSVAGYIQRWFTYPQTVTHPSTNRARRRVITLIETNALLLSQSTSCMLPTQRHFRPYCLYIHNQQLNGGKWQRKYIASSKKKFTSIWS